MAAVLKQFGRSLDLGLEKHRITVVLEAFDASLTKGVAQVEEQKMAPVSAQFDRSLDVGLAKHAAAAEEAAVSVGHAHMPSRDLPKPAHIRTPESRLTPPSPHPAPHSARRRRV